MRIKTINIIFACWYLMIFSIGTEYLSKPMFLLELSTFLGLIMFIKLNMIKKKDLIVFLGMFIIVFGVIVSRLFYTANIPIPINILFVVKMTVFFMFMYIFMKHYQFPLKSLYIMSFFVFPHFIGYLFNLVPYVFGQIGGWHGDPNYLAPDLLTSFIASVFLVFNKKINSNKKIIFLVPLVISLFLILLSISRTALMSVLLSIALMTLLSFLHKKIKFVGLYTFISFFVFLIIFFTPLLDYILNNSLYLKIEDRFLAKGGGSLQENERYITWALAYDLIQETGLFQGYGREEFLQKVYRFAAHNVFLDIGIISGSYTFWVFIYTYFFGFIFWFYTIAKNIKSLYLWSTDIFLFIFSLSVIFMMLSISVSHMYYFWFILYLIYTKLILYKYKKINRENQ